MHINLRKALVAGIVGTVVFDVVGFLLTGVFWDIPSLLGSKLIGEGGLALGVLGHYSIGVVLAINVPTLVPILEQFFGFQIMPGDVYYVTAIPSELETQDVLVIAISAFVLTSLATLYPARRAALVNPAAPKS